MLKSIFFIYKDEVVTELTANILKPDAISVFSINKISEDFTYQIDDLNPDLVLIDERLYQENSVLIESVKKNNRSSSYWVLLSYGLDKGIFDALMPLPLKAKSIKEDLEHLLAAKTLS